MSLVQRPDKELWPGVTKQALAEHYATIAPAMLPHLRDRPLTLVRAPDGLPGTFYQKSSHHMPDRLERCEDVDYVMANDKDDLVALADQACVELHGWTSRCSTPDRPDRVVFDLDPPGIDDFPVVQQTARTLCTLLAGRGAGVYPLLTGSKGIHVVVPLRPDADFSEVAAFASAVGDVLCRADDRLTMQIRKDKRRGRVFVDTLRNRRHQTSVMPWSSRAREGAPFAVPITVADLDDEIDPRQARIGDAARWMERDAWAGFEKSAMPLARIMHGS